MHTKFSFMNLEGKDDCRTNIENIKVYLRETGCEELN